MESRWWSGKPLVSSGKPSWWAVRPVPPRHGFCHPLAVAPTIWVRWPLSSMYRGPGMVYKSSPRQRQHEETHNMAVTPSYAAINATVRMKPDELALLELLACQMGAAWCFASGPSMQLLIRKLQPGHMMLFRFTAELGTILFFEKSSFSPQTSCG